MTRSIRLAAILVWSISGCGRPVLVPNQPLRAPQRLREIHEDGTVVYGDKGIARLAGIHMRPVNETAEPEALERVRLIVDNEIDVYQVAGDASAVVYYRQPIGYAFTGTMPVVALAPKFARGNLNELLVRLGLARHDATAQLPTEVANALIRAQQEYDAAVARGEGHISLAELAAEPSRLFIESAYITRVVSGDHKCQTEECKRYYAKLEKQSSTRDISASPSEATRPKLKHGAQGS